MEESCATCRKWRTCTAADRNCICNVYKKYSKEVLRMGKKKAAKPTYRQKKYISAAAVPVRDWLVLEESDDRLRLVHRGTGKTRIVMK